MKITSIFSYIPYKKYLAGVLVFTILVSQTIHVDFFEQAGASPENYRDIVSIVVDKATYGAERTRILRYANDIAGYLGGVRTSILVVDPQTPAAIIAEKNEKLYYEGDGEDDVSSLVGTVLIGNIPIPKVIKNGTTFSSLYPYVDFADKTFVYNDKNSQYIYNTESKSESVEIWHGIINPAAGRNWEGSNDISKIGQFLDKTHQFYTKSGKFAPSTLPPKVLYYDGQSESKSTDARAVFQYELSMKNSENLAYNRFTKYLLGDISSALRTFDAKNADSDIASIYASLGLPQGSDTLSDEQIKKLPDIQSREVILGFLKNFKQIFNEKTLGDELLAVHNAGRYTSGSTVSADILPVTISLMDEVARSTLKASNDGISELINASLSGGIASKIVIFDKNIPAFSGGINGIDDALERYKKEYKNYYFGQLSENILSPEQCTIARGSSGDVSQFGRSVLVEANSAFDISSTQAHIDLLTKDTATMTALHKNANFACFNASLPKLDSYWGGNSILKTTAELGNGVSPDSFLFEPSPASNFRGFSFPIASLGGMKETSRLTIPSIANCINNEYQYTLLQPYVVTYNDEFRFGSRNHRVAWPTEWNVKGKYNGAGVPTFTCNTVHEVGAPISFGKSAEEYATRSCFAGNLSVDGKIVKTATNTCISSIAGPRGAIDRDNTVYEDRYYHTIPSIWSHVSPTQSEIDAAKVSGVTPSLPIDHIRYVEFLTPKGNIARLDYPNFFNAEGNDIASVRNWLKNISNNQWKAIIDKENSTSISSERAAINAIVPPGTLPASPIDWNAYVSDATIEKILQARNWLQPDIANKYRLAIESMLSYSHENTSITPVTSSVPKIPTLSHEYEIAYLGLPSSFEPDLSEGSSDSNSEYETGIREIEGANISEDSNSELDPTSKPSSKCGPPDGVPLLQWPSAIMCWIESQFPPRILAGSCGPSTIGIDSPFSGISTSPSSVIIQNSTALSAFYNGAQVVPHLPRSSIQLQDSITVDLHLQKGMNYLTSLPDTIAHLEIKNIVAGGKNIAPSEYDDFLVVSPSSVMVGEKGASFILESQGKIATVELQSYYIIPLPDGKELRIDSESLYLNITPEYYSINLAQSGVLLNQIDVTSPEVVTIATQKILQNGSAVTPSSELSFKILDDTDGSLIFTGVLNTSRPTLPVDITKKIGIYRLIVSDRSGITGEITFSVTAGKLSQIRIVPVSSALVKGSTTVAMVRLQDRLGNPIAADIHTLNLEISGGYIQDITGEKKTSMTMDVMEGQVPIIVGSTNPGKINIQARVSDVNITGNQEIVVHNGARVTLIRDSNPRVGGTTVPVRIEIQDESGKRLTGFSSVVSWKLPDGAGSFSKEAITIVDGISERVEYIPGTVAGNHALTLDVPGVGSISNMIFSLLPGDPLYVSHVEDNANLIFSLRDRYNNIVSTANLPASLSYNNTAPRNISFVQGIYSMPLQGGQYNIVVPELKNSKIIYVDDVGSHTISGISNYNTYIAQANQKLDFAPDYNARYTILAGGAYLREGEDILFNTTPGQSQSLAVTTLLDTPTSEDAILSIYPGGAYRVNASLYDMSINTSLSLSNNFPLLSVSDLVRKKQIAQVLYTMQNALLETCQVSATDDCMATRSGPTIRLISNSGSQFTLARNNEYIQLNSSLANILSIKKDGSIIASSQIKLVPKDNSTNGLEISVLIDDIEVAHIMYFTDHSLSVARNSDITQATKNTPTLIGSNFSITSFVPDSLYPNRTGYKIIQTTSDSKERLDETKNGPMNIDSLGALSDISSVGWKGNNTMLLAYAGGDSVGESTRFFHTYTLVNLGDPVTHVDHGRTGTEIDGIDRTVGSIIARSNGNGIANFFHRDMNADSIEDLVVLYQDGYMELFLNHKGKFRSRGMISYNRDIDNKNVFFADFIADGFGDIIGLNTEGDLILVDNSNRKFSRPTITIADGAILPRHISQMKVYDMDQDKRDDIIYITASGELGVLYGTSTVGLFTKKVLDPTLGITLSPDPINTGGAIKSNTTPQISGDLSVDTTIDTSSLDDSMLEAEVYYQYRHVTPLAEGVLTTESLSGSFDAIAQGEQGSRQDTFVRSQYAVPYGLQIQKTYINKTHATLYADDLIQARIVIKNTTSSTIRNIEYLDTIPGIFSLEQTQKYTVTTNNTTIERPMESLSSDEYDAYFVGRDLLPGQSLEIIYDLVALPASYGEMIVGDLEKGTVGADVYGDVGFKTSTTCGASMLLWASGPGSRDYTRGTHEFGAATLPESLATRLADTDNNSIPDSIENMSLSDRQKAYTDISRSQNSNPSFFKKSLSSGQINLELDPKATDTIIDATQNLLDGLSCGFGGGGCLNSPLNWAPLAPGSSPTLFGMPLNIKGMTPSSGMPIFSGLTGVPVYGPWGCIPVPATYPASPIGLSNTCTANLPNAGGMLGTTDPLNFIRVYVTPTLTLGMGTAVCLGGPAIAAGQIPPQGLSPLIKGGNCIVVAKSLPVCKGDGSIADGDVSAVSGLGTISDTWNSSSCTPTANTLTETENVTLTSDIIGYLKSPDTTRLNSIYSRMATRGARSSGGGPLLQIGGPSSGGGTIDIDIDSNTRLPNSDGVIKTKNKRVAAFPDFFMDWLTRQTEEMTTSLFTPPNLTIIPPTDLGQNAQVDGSYKDFSEKLGNAYSEESLKNIQQASGDSYDSTANSKATQKPLGQAKPTLNSVKTAYTMVGKLPFISVKQKTIPLNIPWVNKRELSKYGNQLNAYKNEFNEAMKRLCATDPSPECAEKKAKLQSGAFIGSVLANLKAIDGYERFPLKIQKYITWKERYIAELLCNVNSIQQVTGGWLRDNGVRFRKWAELFVLIRAIAESWQPILDIFAGTSKSCGVCRNERYNLQYWKFKLLSMLIPSLPVIKFPKFPDLVLDLSDVRMGISFTMPNFDPRISPIRLPNLPQLSLGDLSAGLSLPGLPLLPRLPDLPDLPDLPSLPRINLPDLPPPPKLPKIAGSIEAFLKVMKLISTMYCFYQKTFLIPEWQAGDIIAQRTERQGTLPFDFINLSLPQFSLPSVREIRVGSHVDYNLRSDFISEFAKKAVEPVNQFKTDLQTIVPKKIKEDVGIEGNHVNLNQKLNFMIEEDPEFSVLQKILADFTSEMEADANTFLEVEDFKKYILTQLTKPEFTQSRLALVGELESARLEAKKTENELVVFNNKKFDLLKEYISSETDDIAKLQNIVDLLEKEYDTDPRLLISNVDNSDSRSLGLLKKFESFQSATSYMSPSSNIDSGLESAKEALNVRISRMTADAASSIAASASSTSVADGYSPRYQGVYVRTPSGVQTQLFDYIDPLSDDTRIDTVDIDQDGDLDYMYILDDSLYVKYNWTKIPNKIQDMTVTVNAISPNDALPYVPDYFHENISVPKNLNFSFVPSLLNETAWRAEFYDRYIEWDNVDIGSHDPAITPKTTIDMFLETSPSNIAGTTLKSIAVQRSITSVRDPASFVLEGRNIQIYTGALSISVSPGRTLYTGSKKVVITYKNKSYPMGQIFTLDPYTGYQFNEVSEVTTDNGKLYLIGPEDGSRTLYQDDLIGLPILPGMHIYASDRGAILHDHISNNDIVLGAGAQYMSYNLGSKKPRYEVSFSYPNGYYYARLQNLTLGKMDRAGVILFAPQMSSDTGAPVVDLPSRIRLPIYSTKTYKISDILTDLSNAELSIDSNLSIDSDSNGSTQDDFTKVGTGFSISNTSITFGSFVTPGKYSMNLRAIDEMGNSVVMLLSVEAYALIPQILSVTSTGNILGRIPESIENTPIHFFRVRSGETPTIVTPNSSLTNTGGLFATGSFFKNIENIDLINGANPVKVDSHGVFILPSGYKIDILPATVKNPMQLLTMNASGSVSHTHTLAFPDGTLFFDGSKATKSQTGVIINSVGGQSQMVSATLQDKSIPGGVYITDTDYKPLVGVARDGNIYVLDPTVTLRYNTKNGYMMIEVVRDGKVMSTLEYRIDFFYTKK